MDLQPKIIKDKRNPVTQLLPKCMVPAVAGAFMGLGDHVMRGGNLNSNLAAGRMLKGSFIMGGFGFFFFGGSFISAQVRKKDDILNNIIGVITTIPLIRNYMAFHYAYPVTIAWMAIATVIKMLNEDPSDTVLNDRFYNYKSQSLIDIEAMLQKPKGEPFVKYTPNSLF